MENFMKDCKEKVDLRIVDANTAAKEDGDSKC